MKMMMQLLSYFCIHRANICQVIEFPNYFFVEVEIRVEIKVKVE